MDQWMRIVAQPLLEVTLGKGALEKTRAARALGKPLSRAWRQPQGVVVSHVDDRITTCHRVAHC